MELAARPGYLPDLSGDGQSPRMSETFWGYVIHEDVDRFDRERLSEAALRFAGLILVLSAYAQWLLPDTFYAAEPFYDKSALSFILGAAGVAIYWFGSRGWQIDVQVDLIRRELRLAHRNARGQSRVRSVLPMSRVESAFIARRKDGEGPSQLFLRFRGSEEVLHVAAGEEADLMVLHRRLSHDLRPIEQRINHRLAKSLPFRTTRAE